MPSIEWSDTYLIGVPDLDADHRRIVGLIAGVFAAVEAGAAAGTVLARVDGLVAVLLPHMDKEREMMAPLSQPTGIAHRRRHLAGHAEFLDRVDVVRQQLWPTDMTRTCTSSR